MMVSNAHHGNLYLMHVIVSQKLKVGTLFGLDWQVVFQKALV